MKLTIKASDLYYKYHKDVPRRHEPKFRGKPDPTPFNRDDLYDILPLLEAVMVELGRDDQRTLHMLEELLNRNMPGFVVTREEVFDFLVETGRDLLE